MIMEHFNLKIPPKMTKRQMQIALLNKVIFAHHLLGKTEEANDGKRLPMVDYLLLNVQLESYRMLIVNYLTALIGRRKNDKNSIYSEKENPKIDNFYEENNAEIKNLEDTRDKLYAHCDLDFNEVLKAISREFIEKCLTLLKQVLDYKGAEL